MDYILLPSYVGFNNEHYLPDLRGTLIQKASYELRILGFNTEIITVPFSSIHKPETVIKMAPRAFTKVKEGRTISLTVAGIMEDVEIPNFIGTSLRNTELLIKRLGLAVDTLIYEYDNQIQDGYITFQFPKPNKLVKSSSQMTLGVSRGVPPDYYIVPDVVNLSLRKAQEKIINSGLRVGKINYEYQPKLLKNTVIEQNMTAQMKVSFPASINLLVSTDKENDR